MAEDAIKPQDLSSFDLQREQLAQIRTLLQALCLISRNLPLSDSLLESINSISHADLDNIPATGPATPAPCDSQARNLDESGDSRNLLSEHLLSHEIVQQGFGALMESSVPLKEVNQENSNSWILKKNGNKTHGTRALLTTFEEAIARQRTEFSSSAILKTELEDRQEKQLANRLLDLEASPSHMGESVQQKKLLESQGLKLAALQRKVRSEVIAELHIQRECASPKQQLFDWGFMRLVRTSAAFFGGLRGDGGTLGMSPTEADERLRRKREAERQRRLEEEEQTRVAIRKRKFFNELLNLVREIQLQGMAAMKRRKQRNDGIQAWHAKQRQRATRAEKLRYQALKADDQEAYMRMVEESKNERLTSLLEKTDELLQRLGAMVQMQKDADRADIQRKEKPKERKEMGKEASDFPSPRQRRQDLEKDNLDSSYMRIKDKRGSKEVGTTEDEQDCYDESDGEGSFRKRDLLEGQRQYNSLVHSIEEKVTRQPLMLKGGELRSYQLEGLQWMLSLYNNNLNGILADEMGLGKTIQTIALLAYLMENKGLSGPHLIIAPKAVLPNWAHEFKTWAPSIVAVLYDGRLEDRKALREQYRGEGKFNVLVTHYDLIMRDKAFLKKIHWHYMIVDEGHRLKNHDCILSRTLVTGYHIRRRLLLTGTPIQNSLQELWSLLNFLLPAIFNSSQNFEDWFNAPFADPSEVSLTEEEQLLVIRRLHQVIRPFLLRRKKAEVEKFLPSKTQVILKCDLSAWQRVYYQQITHSGRVGLDSGTGKSKGLLNTAMQLRKCCNHPYLFLEGGDYNIRRLDEIIRASGKFELLDRLLPKLQKAGHRVLLFSQMTRLMDILEIYLGLQGFKYMRLDGGTKTEERGVLLAQFNAPDSPFFMFLLSTRAGGLGLNLQTADTVILFDSDWNPQMDQQAEDRAHRIGQKKEVRVFVLVSVGSIEEEILERAKSKMGIDAKVIQAGLFNTTSTAQERRVMLEQIMRRGTDALGTDVPSEREINRLAARNDEEFFLFEKMDDERRNKEGYRSRLMEEHEIPDWVFLLPENSKTMTGKRSSDTNIGNDEIPNKRRRKEVVYTDVLSDSQWLKAVEDGEDVIEAVKTQLSKRLKRKDQQPTNMGDINLDSEPLEQGADADSGILFLDGETMKEQFSKKGQDDGVQFESLDTFEEPTDPLPEEKRMTKKLQVLKFKHFTRPVHAEESMPSTGQSEDGLDLFSHENSVNWKGLRRKRTNYSHMTSEDSGPTVLDS